MWSLGHVADTFSTVVNWTMWLYGHVATVTAIVATWRFSCFFVVWVGREFGMAKKPSRVKGRGRGNLNGIVARSIGKRSPSPNPMIDPSVDQEVCGCRRYLCS
jgi:hypothetical protein